MVTYIPINLTSERLEYSKRFEEALDYVFRNTFANINAHVLYNFKSPTEKLGVFDFLLFIDIPYGTTTQGRINYCKWNGKFINSLAVAVRRLDMPDVIDVDEENFYTERGSFNYIEEIESDRKAFCNYVYENIPKIKHFDIAFIYVVSAPKCSKKFYLDYIAFNRGIPLASAITYAVNVQKNMYGRVNALLFDDGQRSATWTSFVNLFIETAEKDTKQGILTKRKVNSITKNIVSKEINAAESVLGNKLCIIKGRPGTGKTHTLLRLMYDQVKKKDNMPSHHCRLLTYNNMLVMDLKQILKSISDFNPTNASISTLHKFFYDIYKDSPVRQLNLDQKEIDNVFGLCLSRVARFNALMVQESKLSGIIDLRLLFRKLFDDGRIELSEKKEFDSYRIYILARMEELDVSSLERFAIDYVKNKSKIFLGNYHRKRFLGGYNAILKQLYNMFHDLEAFQTEYKIKTAYMLDEIRASEEFQKKYEELYEGFMKYAEQRFQDEDVQVEDIAADFHIQLDELDKETSLILRHKEKEEEREEFNMVFKKIKRKVNWSKYILVDEGQDCQLYEKALLLELNGSDDTIVATGGSSQLIRTSVQNDWSVCLGQRIDVSEISLTNRSHRQKGNILDFINTYSERFNLGSAISIPDEMRNKGRVIIDCRHFKNNSILPLDIINELYLCGKDYGCSNYENLLFLFPHKYIERETSSDVDVIIDTFGYIDIRPTQINRHLEDLGFPEQLRVVDGTVDDKRNLQIGQDNTRCILYESCRGLESWNIMCIDLDTFYYEKISSRDAEEYAISNAELFVSRNELQAMYAALWCYMAMTRAIDTLYLKIKDVNSDFSRKLLSVAEQCEYVVEILRD